MVDGSRSSAKSKRIHKTEQARREKRKEDRKKNKRMEKTGQRNEISKKENKCSEESARKDGEKGRQTVGKKDNERKGRREEKIGRKEGIDKKMKRRQSERKSGESREGHFVHFVSSAIPSFSRHRVPVFTPIVKWEGKVCFPNIFLLSHRLPAASCAGLSESGVAGIRSSLAPHTKSLTPFECWWKCVKEKCAFPTSSSSPTAFLQLLALAWVRAEWQESSLAKRRDKFQNPSRLPPLTSLPLPSFLSPSAFLSFISLDSVHLHLPPILSIQETCLSHTPCRYLTKRKDHRRRQETKETKLENILLFHFVFFLLYLSAWLPAEVSFPHFPGSCEWDGFTCTISSARRHVVSVGHILQTQP